MLTEQRHAQFSGVSSIDDLIYNDFRHAQILMNESMDKAVGLSEMCDSGELDVIYESPGDTICNALKKACSATKEFISKMKAQYKRIENYVVKKLEKLDEKVKAKIELKDEYSKIQIKVFELLSKVTGNVRKFATMIRDEKGIAKVGYLLGATLGMLPGPNVLGYGVIGLTKGLTILASYIKASLNPNMEATVVALEKSIPIIEQNGNKELASIGTKLANRFRQLLNIMSSQIGKLTTTLTSKAGIKGFKMSESN